MLDPRYLRRMGTAVDKLYRLDCEAGHAEAATLTTTQEDNDLDVWHYRLGHASEQTIKEMVYSDVCGPMPTESIGGNRYFVTFIDDY